MSSDDRYSRQSYSIGQDAMCKLSQAKVLIFGYSTLGQEICKNLALLGINNIHICAKHKLLNYQKTGLYYKTDEFVPIDELQKLNPTIEISQVDIFDIYNELIVDKIKEYKLVVVSNMIFDDAVHINRITNKLNIPFIMTGCYGLTGYVFNDFGQEFIVNDIDGEDYENLIIDFIDEHIIKFKDRHKLSDHDWLEIKFIDGTIKQLQIARTQTPLIIHMIDDIDQDKLKYDKIIKKKVPEHFTFQTLLNSMEQLKSIFADSSVPITRANELHELNKTYAQYLKLYGETPRAWSQTDAELFCKLIPEFEKKNNAEQILIKKFCYTLRGDLLPMASIISGVASQEVLKALTHKFIPINQWYHTDQLDLILDDEVTNFQDETGKNYKSNDKYEGLINIFGKTLVTKIQSSTPFIIGSGAIGCELIKNLGMMGVKNIHLTDMDYIEKSNLSRQFLFSDADIKKSKAKTAANKIQIMNPDININVYEHKICEETENIFNKEFHDKIDVYMGALDNVDARMYMDKMAITYSKPMIDSGTMGSKGNVQVIIPHLTESYGSAQDPEENTGIPICTLKAFPYKADHTIQWARELFETEFVINLSLINKYRNPDELEKANENDTKLFLEAIIKYDNFKISSQSYYQVLLAMFDENFVSSVDKLIEKYSKIENQAEITDKKFPTKFNINTDLINDFMNFGFVILNQIFNSNFNYQEFNISELNLTNQVSQNISDDINLNKNIIISILPLIPQINEITFEKDNDELGHIMWINECANLRNIQYSIPVVSLYETRKIAGNIIPAMITTTSLIAGYQILEYIKIIKLYSKNKHCVSTFDSDIDIYKNRFVNLNTNYFDGINPAKSIRYKLSDNLTISLWTCFNVNTNITCDIIKEIEEKINYKIDCIINLVDKSIIYNDDVIELEIINPQVKLVILLNDALIDNMVFINKYISE